MGMTEAAAGLLLVVVAIIVVGVSSLTVVQLYRADSMTSRTGHSDD